MKEITLAHDTLTRITNVSGIPWFDLPITDFAVFGHTLPFFE